ETKIDPEILGIALFRSFEELFQLAISARQHHELDVESHEFVERLSNQVQAFLSGHARDHRYNRGGAPMRQLHFLAQVIEASHLAVTACGRISSADELIGGGVPFFIIRSIEDADEAVAFGAQDPIKPESELRLISDLKSVSRTNCRNGVSQN